MKNRRRTLRLGILAITLGTGLAILIAFLTRSPHIQPAVLEVVRASRPFSDSKFSAPTSQQVRTYQAFVAQAIAAANKLGRENWPFRSVGTQPVRKPGDSLTLSEKANAFEAEIQKRFLSEDGRLFRHIRYASPGDRWDLGDMAVWQGVRLGQVALQYVVEPTPETARTLCRLVEGMTLFIPENSRATLLRGVQTGLQGRVIRVEDGASYDSLTGFVFGLSLAWSLGDEETRQKVKTIAALLADRLVESGFRILDQRGKPTRYGDLRPGGSGIAGRGITLLGVTKLAAVSNPDVPRYEELYRKLLTEDGLRYSAVQPAIRLFPRYYNPPDYSLAALSLYALLRLETDPNIRPVYQKGMRNLWELVRGQGNALIDFAFLSEIQNLPWYRRPWGTKEALQQSLGTLEEFTLDGKVARAIRNSARRDVRVIPQGPFKLVETPLPIWQRPAADFLWQRSAFSADDYLDLPAGAKRFPSIDFLLAYWLGRYHNLL